MGINSEITVQKLNYLNENFKESDYIKYKEGNITFTQLCKDFECTAHIMSKFFKTKGYERRQNLKKAAVNESIFDNIDSAEKAYILGFYIADGYITGPTFGISLNYQDREILEKLRDCMSPMSKITEEKEHIDKNGVVKHTMLRFCFRNKHIIEILNTYGIGYNKTYLEKRIKHLIPNEFMWDFVRGYFDGDGCISSSNVTKIVNDREYYYNNLGWTIISKDKTILEELDNFFHEEGINTCVYPDSKGNYLVGSHSKIEILKIYNKLYTNCDFYMKRKRNKFNEIMGIPSQAIE